MKELYLGVSREIITPEIGGCLYGYRPDVFSERVEDELTATAFYFKQGEKQALMISLTVCLLNTELSEEILSKLEQRFGIPAGNCMLCATHTHSGPNTAGEIGWGDIDRKYCDEIFIPAILKVTEDAMKAPRSVKLGTASDTSLVGINRRELNFDNIVCLGQNPWGCFNPKMSIIAFVDESGKPVANMIHYGAHGTAAGCNHEISRDWSGIMIDTLERQSGAITAFFNGPEGDVGPRLSNQLTVGDIGYVHELGAVAAQDAVRIYKKIFSYNDAELRVSERKLGVPLKKRIPVEEAKRLLEAYKNDTINIRGMMKSHFEDVVRDSENGVPEVDKHVLSQTVIALGDMVFASFPYELFSEIGMRIDGAFGNKSVLSLSNTNGSEGYFVTEDAICRGGYEVDCFLYGHTQSYYDNADYHLMCETVKHINDVINESEE